MMGDDLCGVVEKKRRREEDGWRVRECTDEDNNDQGEKTRFWGALALALALYRSETSWEEQRRRKHAPAANGSCSMQSSIGG